MATPASDLRLRRLAAGLRILDVAHATGLPPTRVSEIERGEGRPPTPDELIAVAAAVEQNGSRVSGGRP
jgi:transcriptional regulator with XRE-family HTH domain